MIPLLLATLIISCATNVANSQNLLRNEVCSNGYGLDCLRFDLLSIAGKMDHNFRLGPGFYLNHDPTVIGSLDSFDSRTAEQFGYGLNSSLVRNLLRKNIKKYLHSLVLTVRLVDPLTVDMASSLSSKIMDFTSHSNSTLSRGHRKKGHHHQALLACVGMIAAIGLATLAALSGKALMTSLLALLLAGVSAVRHSHDANAIPCSAKTVGIIDAHSRHGPSVDRNEPTPPFYPMHLNPLEAPHFHSNHQISNVTYN